MQNSSSRIFSIFLSCSGTVQGVGFRVHVVRIAKDLGLSGWVRNNDDNTVSIFAEGEKEKLGRLKARLMGLHHIPGPDVRELKVVEEEKEIPVRKFNEFQIH